MLETNYKNLSNIFIKPLKNLAASYEECYAVRQNLRG